MAKIDLVALLAETEAEETAAKAVELSEEQKAAQEEQAWWAQHLPEVKDAKGLNALLGRIAEAPKPVKIMVRNRAKEIGVEYDEARKVFAPVKVKEAA